MNSIKQWFSTHKISTHTIAAAWGVMTILWATDPAFKNYLYGIYSALPKGMHEFVAGIIIPLALYLKSQKSPAPPTNPPEPPKQ